jgi:predicted methyltransferase
MNLARTLSVLAFVSVPAYGCTRAPPANAPVEKGLPPPVDAKLSVSLAGRQRTEAERARDVYRHPRETLEFFGLRDDMSVVELTPGEGWYTAVLAPVLAERGALRPTEVTRGAALLPRLGSGYPVRRGPRAGRRR